MTAEHGHIVHTALRTLRGQVIEQTPGKFNVFPRMGDKKFWRHPNPNSQ
jgi:hypothetical protein